MASAETTSVAEEGPRTPAAEVERSEERAGKVISEIFIAK